jgi:CheY-like chemotaxis protein
MDHMMPVMDGVETVKKIRQIGYRGCIAALTADAIVGREQFFKENGFDDFLSKPIDGRSLNNILCKYIRDRHPEEAAKYTKKVEIDTSAGKVNPLVYEGFIRDSKHAVEVFEDEKSTVENIMITAHGIKSAAANAGEKEISETARELEFAAKGEETEKMEKTKDKLWALLKELIEKEDDDDITEDPYIPKNIPTKRLVNLKNALEDYDEKQAGAIIGELVKEGLFLKPLKKIKELLLHAEYEMAAKICEDLIDEKI